MAAAAPHAAAVAAAAAGPPVAAAALVAAADPIPGAHDPHSATSCSCWLILATGASRLVHLLPLQPSTCSSKTTTTATDSMLHS